MKECSICGTMLPLPINEYGPIYAPLCRSCFLAQDSRLVDPEIEITATRDEIKELGDLIRAENGEIHRLRNKLEEARYSGNFDNVLDDLKAEEQERDCFMEKRGELQGRLYRLIKSQQEARRKEQMKLIQWTEG